MDKKFLELSQIKLRGIKEVEGMKFHEIEGGFGKGKKAMLVKEIANIHGRGLREVNQSINMNRKRFNDGLDILDLKGTEFAINLIDSGIYTQNSINASNNIYLLSERGYSKLLKILEDDVAWNQYEKLVDGYFNMRAEKKQLSAMEQLKLQYQVLDEHEQKLDTLTEDVDSLTEDVKDIKNRMTIETGAQKTLCDLVSKKVTAILGGKGTPAYNELSKKAFRQCWKDYKDKLNVASYKDTPIKDFELGKKVIINWKPSRELELMILGCNAQIRM